MSMRRLTRLTNGFSKKWENLKAAYALYFAYYNLLQDSQFDSLYSSNGSWYYKARLVTSRFADSIRFQN